MDVDQPSFTDIEYGNRRRVSRREQFLETMDATIPWVTWVELIEAHYYRSAKGKRGRKAKPVETMLRMYLLQVWFSLSDEGVEDAIYDSYAMRRFLGLDFALEQVPDATTLLHFRHLLEKHKLGERLFAAQNEIFEQQGRIMRGGSIVEATIIAAPSSTKNATGERDPQMHQSKKGNQWYFGMKAHIGVDAGTGYVHSVTATAANVHDLDEAVHLVRRDDQVVYADAGYQGAAKRPEIADDEHLSTVQWRIAARKGVLKTMTGHDRAVESRKASVRAKVEHPFLIAKRDFAFTKTRYRGIAKNLNHLHMLFASANWLMRARAVALTGSRRAAACPQPLHTPDRDAGGR
jgi:transposase, IS5 family